jgi:hypothetical protein
MTIMVKLCFLGCEQKARFQLPNGKWCCSENIEDCPSITKNNKFTYCDFCGKKILKENLNQHMKMCCMD